MCSRLLPSVASHGGRWRGEGSFQGEPPSGHPSHPFLRAHPVRTQRAPAAGSVHNASRVRRFDLTKDVAREWSVSRRRVDQDETLTKARGRNSAATHPDAMAKIVDIGRKPDVKRRAVATGTILLRPATDRAIRDGPVANGDVLVSAEVAALHAMKSVWQDRKSTRLNSSHQIISYAVFCLKKKKTKNYR